MKKILVVFAFLSSACGGEPLAPEPELAAVAVSPAELSQVVIHVSDHTAAQWTYDVWKYAHTHGFVETALKSDGTPYTILSDAEIGDGALLDSAGNPRYPVLISLANEAVSNAVVNAISTFVFRGGTAYIGSSSFTRHADGTPRMSGGRQIFALEQELGLEAGGWRMTNYTVRKDSDLIFDELPIGSNIWWWMPLRWDVHHFGPSYNPYYPFYAGPHWSWVARPEGTAPATMHMAIAEERGFYLQTQASYWGTSYDLQLADVDGDGKSDFIGRSGLDIQVGLSNGQKINTSSSWTIWGPGYDHRFGDLDGDGRADLVGRTGTSDVQLARSLGNTFAKPSHHLTWWSPAFDLQLGDVDCDGDDDLIGRSGTNVQVALSFGTTVQEPSTQWATWLANYDMKVADVNGDGCADLVGRLGNDVQAALSSGGGFAAPSQWTTWDTAYDYRLADVDGDRDADIIGRAANGDVQVGLSNQVRFLPSTNWTTNTSASIFTGDLNGDGRADLFGRNDWRVEAMISTGHQSAPSRQTDVKFASKQWGDGMFYYNAGIMPFVGYGAGIGASARLAREYKTLRDATDRGFFRLGQPIVRLAPWPYPHNHAFIYRHDHTLNLDIVAHELSHGVRGEYYIWPNRPCNDYPAGVTQAVQSGAIIGAHVNDHVALDNLSYSDARSWLSATTALIAQTGVDPIYFVAPGYFAVLESSMNAVWDEGFLTAGEQGFSPFPHFSVDPSSMGEIGSLLQLPVTGALDQSSTGPGNVTTMPPAEEDSHVRIHEQLGALLNLYDHAGECLPNNFGADEAARYLNYVFRDPTNGIWSTTSPEIRDWWLERERHAFDVSRSAGAGSVTLTITQSIGVLRAPTPFSADPVGLRIELDPTTRALADVQTQVFLQGVPSTAFLRRGSSLFVRIGNTPVTTIRFGP